MKCVPSMLSCLILAVGLSGASLANGSHVAGFRPLEPDEPVPGRPTALAQGDFDGDGVPDLLVGYAGESGDFLTMQRGNSAAVIADPVAARERRTAGTFTALPFRTRAVLFEAPGRPDFVGVGDFDNDGYLDAIVGTRGGTALHVLTGDGQGGLMPTGTVELPGALTTLVTGEVNRPDGLTDLVVGVRGAEGGALLVYQSPEGALRGAPEVLWGPVEPTVLLLARLRSAPWVDLVAAAGDELVIVRGRDRESPPAERRRGETGFPVVESFSMPSAIQSLAWGDFVAETRTRYELALLLDDGALRLLDPDGETIGQRFVLGPKTDEGLSGLLPVRMSGAKTHDLAVLDRNGRRLLIIAGMTDVVAAEVVVSRDLTGRPVAALPMRLNRDALTDLVLLSSDASAPLLVETATAATIVVDTDTDGSSSGDGLCSLREAIANANVNGDVSDGDCASGTGVDAIEFNIAGGGTVATIAIGAPLLEITDPVTIDGTTQGCGAPPCIALDGTTADAFQDGLALFAGNSSIRGLAIGNFDSHGILIESSGNVIENCFIGTDLSGTLAQGNAEDGIHIGDGSDNTVGGTIAGAGNLISGNGDDGVSIEPGNGNQLLGNYIGTDVSGTIALANNWGVFIADDSAANIVGGTSPGAGNLLSGNQNHGVYLSGADVIGNEVLGNRIGTDLAGRSPLGNGQAGVRVNAASNNLIGSTAVGARNLISANDTGVYLSGAGAIGNHVLGNWIGTDSSGTAGLGNTTQGVRIDIGSDNFIGGTAPGSGNLVSSNGSDGILLANGADSNQVLGNWIGTDVTGAPVLGNLGMGVEIIDSGSNAVGAMVAGAANLIAGNAAAGVQVEGTMSVGNAILQNAIFDNGLLGIDLAVTPSDGNTPNDAGDSDTGPNGLQNFPALSSGLATFSEITVEGNLDSGPNGSYWVEFYANTSCDVSGYGEGERFLGGEEVISDASGQAALNVVLAALVSDGEQITATATDAAGNTSEFSACVTANCLETAEFPETLEALDADTWVWATPGDVRYVKGDLTAVATYATTAAGTMFNVSSLDMSQDLPASGGGLYYLVQPLGCGSWQTEPGAEPARDAELP